MIRPNPYNKRSLELFFKEYDHLSSSELAILAGVGMETIRRWRRKVGLRSVGLRKWGTNLDERPFVGTKMSGTTERMPDPSCWFSREWFWQKYVVEKKGMRVLARITGKAKNRILYKLRDFKIPIRRKEDTIPQSENPCCDRKWLEENYEIEGLSLEKCAELAGVNPYSIYRWLVKFRMHIRNEFEYNIGERSSNYGKKIITSEPSIPPRQEEEIFDPSSIPESISASFNQAKQAEKAHK